MLVILNTRHEDSLFSKINVFASLDSGCAGVGATRGAEDGSPRVDCRKFDESTVENVTRQRPRRAVPESVSCSLSTRVLATPRTARGSDDSSCRAFRSSASSVPVDILRAHDWLAPKTSWPAAVSRSKRRSGGRDTRGQILLSESNDRRPLAPVPPGNATNAPTLLARALVRPDALGRFEKQEPPPPPRRKFIQEHRVESAAPGS